jgi:hypothetical protein
MNEIKHTPGKPGSAYGYYTKGCRCPECETAARTKARRYNPDPKPRGGQRKPEPDHGTSARYSRGCHCELCRAANTEKGRKYKRAKAEGAEPRVRKARVKPTVNRPLTAHAKELRIVGALKPVKPRTYEPEPDICGIELDSGSECRRRMPCSRPEHQEA